MVKSKKKHKPFLALHRTAEVRLEKGIFNSKLRKKIDIQVPLRMMRKNRQKGNKNKCNTELRGQANIQREAKHLSDEKANMEIEPSDASFVQA